MRIAGYAAIFDHVDHGGDIVRKGAFGKVAAALPLFRQHDSRRRIGTVEQATEDARGLRVIASLVKGEVVPEGAGLSFGYRVRKARNGTYRQLFDLDLIEISVVETPMQPLARVLKTEITPKETDYE